MPDLTLDCTIVQIGNNNGKTLDGNNVNAVLGTSDLFTCTAVCGYNQRLSIAFMIHSDSTGAQGQGGIDLITGLNNLLGRQIVGTGRDLYITLLGGSINGTLQNLQANLPDAVFNTGAQSETAYISWNGHVASTKRSLAEAFGVQNIVLNGCDFSGNR